MKKDATGKVFPSRPFYDFPEYLVSKNRHIKRLAGKIKERLLFRFFELIKIVSMRYPLAIITGSAQRLGRGFALYMAREGYAIVLHYNNSQKKAAITAKEVQALGVPAFIVQADLADVNQVAKVFSYVDDLIRNPDLQLDPLKVLINCAAIMIKSDARTISTEEFDAVINLNLRAPFICAQMAFPRMKNGGLVVNISDIAGQKAWSSYPAYTISKAGLDSMTKVLARSFAPMVRVNGIAPGLAEPPEKMQMEDWKKLINRLPIKRSSSQEELNLALELLLKNEYITGHTINVDGGYSLLS